ncbi:MAG: DUF998 domain-containing protein [Dehalococcoidia bacterium]
MWRRITAICGMLAPLLYLSAVISGGILWKGYSHLSQAVSELTGAGAPCKPLLDPIFSTYNVLLFLFGLGIFIQLRHIGKASLRTSSVILMAAGIIGLIMTLFFPQDLPGSELTFRGTTHILLAGILSILSILAVLLFILGAKVMSAFANLRIHSIVSLVFIIVFGGLAAVGASSGSGYFGLYERITIGAFLQWVFVLAVRLYQNWDFGLRICLQIRN